MTTKRKTENDLVVSPSVPAVTGRRKTATRTRTRRAVEPAETLAASAPETDPITPEQPVVTALHPSHEEIAQLAYSYWQARGCQGGSAEEDWLRAEQALRAKAVAAS